MFKLSLPLSKVNNNSNSSSHEENTTAAVDRVGLSTDTTTTTDASNRNNEHIITSTANSSSSSNTTATNGITIPPVSLSNLISATISSSDNNRDDDMSYDDDEDFKDYETLSNHRKSEGTTTNNNTFFSSISFDTDPIPIENMSKLIGSSPSTMATTTTSEKSTFYTSNIKMFECFDAVSSKSSSDKVWKRDFQTKPLHTLVSNMNHHEGTTTNLSSCSSQFNTTSCYIVLHLYHHSHSAMSPQSNKPALSNDESRDETNFKLLEQLFTVGSLECTSSQMTDCAFTPRGLEYPFASTRLDSQHNTKYLFDLYVWYGKESSEFVKSRTIERALNLESLLHQPHAVEQLFHSGKPQSFYDLVLNKTDVGNSATTTPSSETSALSSLSSSSVLRHHLLSRIRAMMKGTPQKSSRHLFEELTLLSPDETFNNSDVDKLGTLLQLRKRPMAGVSKDEEHDSLESPRKKERTQLSPLNTRDVEHVEEPKVLSGRELAKACHYVCSKITDFLFLGSAAVAQDKKKLNENGITHIINSAASVYCDNYFPNDFTYYSLSLYDDPNESIIGSFYGVIEFIENAIKNGGKVFIHCQMGVSRSCCLTISYMMWKYKMSFARALDDVKQKRACCSPNAGFLVQLTQWETILGLNEKARKEPKSYLYRISPLNNFYAIHKELVPKLCHNTKNLDSRTCFLLQTKYDHCFLWIGSKSTNELQQAAEKFIGVLKSYSPIVIKEWIRIHEGQETEEFNQAMDTLEIDPRRANNTSEYPDLKYLQMTHEEAMDLLRQLRNVDKTADLEAEKELKEYKNGTLFSFEDGKFSEFDYFDSEDIADDMCYVMLPENEPKILVMIGYDVDLGDDSVDDKGEEIGELFIEWKKLPADTSIQVCEEDDPEFFRYFKNG